MADKARLSQRNLAAPNANSASFTQSPAPVSPFDSALNAINKLVQSHASPVELLSVIKFTHGMLSEQIPSTMSSVHAIYSAARLACLQGLTDHGTRNEQERKFKYELRVLVIKKLNGQLLDQDMLDQYLHFGQELPDTHAQDLLGRIMDGIVHTTQTVQTESEEDSGLQPLEPYMSAPSSTSNSGPSSSEITGKKDKFLSDTNKAKRSAKATPAEEIATRMKEYREVFSSRYQNKNHEKFLNASLAKDERHLIKFAKTIKIYSKLDDGFAKTVAYERDLVNIKMTRRFLGENASILGCATSSFIETDGTRMHGLIAAPGNQVCISMRVPFFDKDGELLGTPVVFSVPAPALDSPLQPELSLYVKPNGALNKSNYELAFETLTEHIFSCAQDNPGTTVVLSAFGVANFLAELSSGEQAIARGIAVKQFVKLIQRLQQSGIKVVYTDRHANSEIWQKVNKKMGGKLQCDFIGPIPGKWVDDKCLIVNAWDPHSVIGNGCARDDSIDGFIGRNSLCHDIHALACIRYKVNVRRRQDASALPQFLVDSDNGSTSGENEKISKSATNLEKVREKSSAEESDDKKIGDAAESIVHVLMTSGEVRIGGGSEPAALIGLVHAWGGDISKLLSKLSSSPEFIVRIKAYTSMYTKVKASLLDGVQVNSDAYRKIATSLNDRVRSELLGISGECALSKQYAKQMAKLEKLSTYDEKKEAMQKWLVRQFKKSIR